ncbi:hypothetical protein ACFFX0_22965 [Citricoccus parietis]|uniref:Uncharacterized protein n=1 Tax=Citricoccus parietis TaxID=592307 RepID=A0ABV5G4N9_9MICC
MPAAVTLMRTSPGPGTGRARSSTERTSRPPAPVYVTARMVW